MAEAQRTKPPQPELVDHLVLSRLTGQPAVQIARSPSAQSVGELLIRDALTGLYNRRYLTERMALELPAPAPAATTPAASTRPLALLVMDLNGLKQVNDTLGHAAGDRLLVAVGRALTERTPRQGVAARHGGDEFVVVLPGWNRVDAHGWALMLLDELARTEVELTSGQWQTGIGASIGLSVWPEDAEDYPGLFAAADLAMYHAKRHQQGGVCDCADLQTAHSRPAALRTGWEAPFVGRTAELAALTQMVAAGGRVVCLVGATGVGKSRLAREGATIARRTGWTVVSDPFGTPGPLAGLTSLLRSLHDTADLQPVIGQTLPAPAGPADTYVESVARFLGEIAERRRLWLWIDDIHRWDEASLALLRQLGSSRLPAGLVVVATLNPAESPVGAQLADYLRRMAADDLPVAVLHLDPLPEQEITWLVRSILMGEIDPDLVTDLLERAAGNPLALHTVLQQWAEQGRLVRSFGRWQRVGTVVAGPNLNLAGTLAERIRTLPANVRHLLEALSVGTHPWPPAAVAGLCGAAIAEVTPWLEAAERLQILVRDGGGYRFANGLMRATVYAGIGTVMRRAWHRLAAEVLAEQGLATPAAMAAHWEQAGDHTRAIAWHQQAAAAAQRLYASSAAGRHWRKAAELAALVPELAGTREQWWQQAGIALIAASRSREALDCLQRAMRPKATPEEAAELLAHMAQCCRDLGDRLGAYGHAQAGLGRLQGRPPSAVMARLYAFLADYALDVDGDIPRALQCARRSAAIARRVGSPDRLAVAFNLTGRAYMYRAQYRQGRHWIRRAAGLAGLSPDTRVVMMINLAVYQPQAHRALPPARWALEEASRQGIIKSMHYAYNAWVQALAQLGRWDEAQARFEDWRRLTWRSGNRHYITVAHCYWSVCAVQHDPATVTAALEQRLMAFVHGDPSLSHRYYLALLQAITRLGRRDFAGCLAQVEATTEGKPAGGMYLAQPILLAQAEAELALGRSDAAERRLRLAVGQGHGYDPWFTDGWATWISGRIAESRGRHAQALALYARAQREPSAPWYRMAAALSEARLRLWLSPDDTAALRLAARTRRRAHRLGLPALVAEAQVLLGGQRRVICRTSTQSSPRG